MDKDKDFIVINFKSAAKRHFEDKCKHMHLEIDESKWNITCLDCGAELNPIWVLSRFCKEEILAIHNIEKNNELLKKLETKRRVKCPHCGTFIKLHC